MPSTITDLMVDDERPLFAVCQRAAN